MKKILLALSISACASAAEPCPRATPGSASSFVTFEYNGCNLDPRRLDELHCETIIQDWSNDSGCRHAAEFLCADEMTMTIVYDPQWSGGIIIYRDKARTCESSGTFVVTE